MQYGGAETREKRQSDGGRPGFGVAVSRTECCVVQVDALCPRVLFARSNATIIKRGVVISGHSAIRRAFRFVNKWSQFTASRGASSICIC